MIHDDHMDDFRTTHGELDLPLTLPSTPDVLNDHLARMYNVAQESIGIT